MGPPPRLRDRGPPEITAGVGPHGQGAPNPARTDRNETSKTKDPLLRNETRDNAVLLRGRETYGRAPRGDGGDQVGHPDHPHGGRVGGACIVGRCRTAAVVAAHDLGEKAESVAGRRGRAWPASSTTASASRGRGGTAVCIYRNAETVLGAARCTFDLRQPQNVTMRTAMCRLTRLPNALSKKTKNHAEAIAAYFMYYNFGRTIRRCG